MYKFRRYSKRSVAVFLSLMIVISAISCLFTGFASAAISAGDVTILNSTDGLSASNSVINPAGTKIGFQRTTSSGVAGIHCNTLANLTDGNFGSQAEFYYSEAPFFDIKAGNDSQGNPYTPATKEYAAIGTQYLDGSERFLQITLPLKGYTDLSNILVVNHKTPNLTTYFYEVFASDSEETLYNTENSVYKYTNTSKQQIQNYKIADGKLTGITHVGLRVYNPCYTEAGKWDESFIIAGNGANIYYPRLFEFNAYGTITAPIEEVLTVDSSDTQAVPSDIGEKVYSDLVARFYDSTNANKSNHHLASLAKMTDGDASTEKDFMSNENNATFTENGGEYMNFDFTIKENSIIKKILVVNHAEAALATEKYDIIVSDTKEGLDTAVPLVKYNNSNGEATQLFTVKDPEGLKANYLRIKVHTPFNWEKFNARGLAASYAVCRFMEMGVYGEEDENANFKFSITHDNSTVADLQMPTETNLTAGMKPEVIYHNAVTGTTYKNFDTVYENISDGNPSTDFHTSDTAAHIYADGSTNKWYTKTDGVYTEVTYNLGTLDSISDLVINNHSTPAIRMGSYELYLSDTYAGLNKAESYVGTINTGGNTQQIIHFTENVTAQYVRLRTYDVCYDHTWSSAAVGTVYFRISDFTVHGTKGTEAANENVVLKTEDNNTTNPVSGKTGLVKNAEFKGKHYNASTATAVTPYIGGADPSGALGLLTDGTVDKELEVDVPYAEGTQPSGGQPGSVTKIHTDGTAYVDIIYTLDGVADISDIVVMGHKQPNLWAISYDIYAGNSLSTLFDSAPIYSYKNIAQTRTQHFTLTNTKAAYVAMRITSATGSTNLSDYGTVTANFGASIIHPRIYEFNVYGTPGAPLDETNFAEGDLSLPSGNSIISDTRVYYFDGTSESGVLPGTLANLTDENIGTEFMGSDIITPFAVPDSTPIQLYTDRYMKIVHELYNNAEISDIFVYNHGTTDLRTYKYKIYASDSKDTLWQDENLIYDFTNTNKSRGQLITKKMSAKYVGMIITEPCTQPFSSDRIATQIYPRLYEFNVFGTGDASSGGGEVTEGVTNIGDTTMPTGNNILKGMIAASISVHNKVLNQTGTVGGSNLLHYLTDGDATTGWHTGTIHGNYFATWDTENNKPVLTVNGDVYLDMVYALGGTATIDKMYFGHHETPQRRMSKWEIYMSDNDDENLFAADNIVKTITNTDIQARGQVVTFDSPIVGVRNIGIRIINPVIDEAFALSEINAENYNSSCNVYPRVNEIAAYGTYEADPFVFDRVINNTSAQIPTGIDLTGLNNLSTPLNPIMDGTDTKTNAVSKVSSYGTAKISDGNLTTEAEIYGFRFAEWLGDKAVYQVNGEKYLDVYYDLGSEADVKYIVWGNHSTRELVTGKYDVYIGNSKSSLYNDENLYASVDNIKTYNKGGTNQVNVIAFDEAQTGVSSKFRYVGVRIHTPVCATEVTDTVTVTETTNNIYARIMEFSVYGNYTDPTFVPGRKKFQDTKDMNIANILAKGENLLEKDNLTLMMNGKRFDMQASTITSNNSFWEDNSGTTHYDFGLMTGQSPTWVFRLDKYEITQIEGFAFQGISLDNEAYYASHIRVHVAEEREDVLADSTVVSEYILEEDGVNRGIYYEFPEGTEPQGTFIAFELVNPVYTATQYTYPRISLLYAWGGEAEVRAFPGNIAENMPIDIYFNNDGEYTPVTEDNLTAKETKNLTDGDKSTSAKINTKGADRETLELIYNLCGDIKIDKIKLNALINSSTGFKTMKVYAGDSITEVRSEDSLIWTYKVGSKTGTITPAKSFSKSKQMRYIRFVFEDTKDYLQFGEIEVIGMDNQKMKTRTITASVTADDLLFSRTKIKTGETSYVSISDSYLEGLIDSDTGTNFTFYDGVVGEDKYDLTMYFGDLRTISNITNNFIKHFDEYWPLKINVYIAETELEVNDPATKPTYVIKKSDVKNNVYSKQLRPMLGRYVRFEFVEFPEVPHFFNPDGTPRITAIIGDIKITGTKVKGMQTSEEDDTLIELTDKKTGIKAQIVRLDINDIFTDVVDMRIVEEKPTNWQKKSMENNSLKVIDDKVYRIELLDLFGNVVTNLDGRELRISVPTPKDFQENTAVIGDASVRVRIEALDTYSVDGYTTANFEWHTESDNKFTVLGMTTSDDPYWAEIGELENFEEGTEEDLNGNDFEVHDASWYESIHTDDGLFTVTPINFQFQNGLKFVAKDISAEAPNDRYETILSMAGGKKVAIYYDMKLYDGATEYNPNIDPYTQSIDVYWTIPQEVRNRFTDLQVYHIGNDGNVSLLYSEYTSPDQLMFQTASFSDFVVVGTAVEGSVGGDGYYGGDFGGVSPGTGESTTTMAVSILFMVAAAYVMFSSARKAKKD